MRKSNIIINIQSLNGVAVRGMYYTVKPEEVKVATASLKKIEEDNGKTIPTQVMTLMMLGNTLNGLKEFEGRVSVIVPESVYPRVAQVRKLVNENGGLSGKSLVEAVVQGLMGPKTGIWMRDPDNRGGYNGWKMPKGTKGINIWEYGFRYMMERSVEMWERIRANKVSFNIVNQRMLTYLKLEGDPEALGNLKAGDTIELWSEPEENNTYAAQSTTSDGKIWTTESGSLNGAYKVMTRRFNSRNQGWVLQYFIEREIDPETSSAYMVPILNARVLAGIVREHLPAIRKMNREDVKVIEEGKSSM